MDIILSSDEEQSTAEQLAVDLDSLPPELSESESEDEIGFDMIQENISSVCEVAENHYSSRSKHQYEMSAPHDSTSEEDNMDEEEDIGFNEPVGRIKASPSGSFDIAYLDEKQFSDRKNYENYLSEPEDSSSEGGEADEDEYETVKDGAHDEIRDNIEQLSARVVKLKEKALLKIANKEESRFGGRRNYTKKIVSPYDSTSEEEDDQVNYIDVKKSVAQTDITLAESEDSAIVRSTPLTFTKVEDTNFSGTYQCTASESLDIEYEEYEEDNDEFEFEDLTHHDMEPLNTPRPRKPMSDFLDKRFSLNAYINKMADEQDNVSEELNDECIGGYDGDSPLITTRSMRLPDSATPKGSSVKVTETEERHYSNGAKIQNEMCAPCHINSEKEEKGIVGDNAKNIMARPETQLEAATRKQARVKFVTIEERRFSNRPNYQLALPVITSDDEDELVLHETLAELSGERSKRRNGAVLPKSNIGKIKSMERLDATLALRKVIDSRVERNSKMVLDDKPRGAVIDEKNKNCKEHKKNIKERSVAKIRENPGPEEFEEIDILLTKSLLQTNLSDQDIVDERESTHSEEVETLRVDTSNDTGYDDNDNDYSKEYTYKEIANIYDDEISVGSVATGRTKTETGSADYGSELNYCLENLNALTGFTTKNNSLDKNFGKKTPSKEKLKARPTNRKSFSFSNERVREIERHNQILLKKILSQKATYTANPKKSNSTSKFNSLPPTKMVTSAALNRKKQQRQIDIDNEMLKRRIESISVRRPHPKNLK